MNNSMKLLLAGAALMVGLVGSSSQATTLDVVRDSSGTPVRTMEGECLRSQWNNDFDSCGVITPTTMISPITVETATKSVYFAFGRSSLSADGKKALNTLAADIKARGAAVAAVRVTGFADKVGSSTANEKLSKKRADVVRKYLVSKGVVGAQVVETRWFGDSVSATSCPDKMAKTKLVKCLQQDRRVDVEIDTVAIAN